MLLLLRQTDFPLFYSYGTISLMQPAFVKKFDFRGVYGKDLVDKDAFYVGLAIQKILPLKKVLVGWDTRASSERLAMNFMQSFKNSQIAVSFLEKCPIDYVTTAANAFDFDYSVMFTGSHNTWEWSGMLMHTKSGVSVQGDLVTQIVEQYNASLQVPYTEPMIDLLQYEDFQPMIEDVYMKKIAEIIPLAEISNTLRVCVDVGDGSGSQALTLLSHYLPQVKFFRINDREQYDDETPHTADPSVAENMQQLISEVQKNGYNAGFAFDSDADRVLAVDEKGNILNGSVLGGALIESLLSLNRPVSTVGYAVECGPALTNAVVSLRERGKSVSALPIPVGRSLLREMIRKGEVDVAIENVGHFYIKDFFMTDSGVFSLALLLYWITTYGALSGVGEKYPDGQRMNFSLPLVENQEEHNEILAAEINKGMTKEIRKITVDGLRYEFLENNKIVSWYATRPSGYEKVEKYYFGSTDSDEYLYLQKKFGKE